MQTLSLALSIASLASAPAPQLHSPDVAQLLIQENTPLQWDGREWRLIDWELPATDDAGGWVASAKLRRSQVFEEVRVIIGQDPGELDQPVRVLRGPQLLSGVQQQGILTGIRVGGRTAYIDNYVGVWLDDTLLVEANDPVAGSGGWTWSAFTQVELGSDGTVLVVGTAVDPAAAFHVVMAADLTAGRMLFNGRDFFPGLSRRIATVERLSLSPDGQHWAAHVEQNNTDQGAILVDGAVLDFGGGRLAIESAPAPLAVEALIGPAPIDRIEEVEVGNDGRVACHLWCGNGPGRISALLRGSTVFRSVPIAGRIFDLRLDASGAIVYRDRNTNTPLWPSIQLENGIVLERQPDLDVDMDGIPDLFGASVVDVGRIARLNGDGLVVFEGDVATVTGGRDAILRTRPARIDGPVCTPLINSTGRFAELVAVGSSLAADNELSLQLYDLPVGSNGYALFSLDSGPPIQPGNSAGVVCLGGSIGRFVSGVFLTDASGTAVVLPDLTALAQPTGTAAVAPGDTWYAQAWYRDAVGGVATSNFSDAVAVTFD